MRGVWWWLALVFCVAVHPAIAWAGVKASASAQPSRVRVGDSLTLTLSVERDDRGTVPTPELPASIEDGFEFEARCSSSSSSIFSNGSFVSRREFQCPLRAKKAGKFKVGFTAGDGDEAVQSSTVVIEVLEGEAPVDPKSDPTTRRPPEALGRAFLWASTDKTEAYVGEQITYNLDFYETRQFLDGFMRPLALSAPSFKDFLTVELEVDDPSLVRLSGRPFRLRPVIQRALFPQKAGTLKVGQAEAAVRMRGRVLAEPIAIDVKPLPADGQPPGFSPNNVGQFDIEASVDRTEVSAGEPFTLTVTVKGQGNIDVIDVGEWPEIRGVKRYDPKVETVRDPGGIVAGERRHAFLVIPEYGGTLTIPGHDFHFFDPQSETYKTATSEPITLEITGEPAPAQAPSEGAEANDDGTPEVSSDDLALAAIVQADTLPRTEVHKPWLTPGRWRMGVLLVPLLAGFGLGASALAHRLAPDEAARARAAKQAEQRALVESAKQAVHSGEGFYAALGKLLQRKAVDVTEGEGKGLPRAQLLALLGQRGVSRDDLDRLESLLETCDAARFATIKGSEQQRRAQLDDALALAQRLGSA